MRIWRTFLVHENRMLPMFTTEECVNNSVQPLCDHCRFSGWGHHFVSKRKYHFIIPTDNEWTKRLDDGVLELQTHILHGLIHCNGFGHLLCINGSEGGSKFVCAREVMDLWDRICTTLHSRKINVVDTSKKRKMDLRLLYGVSYGETWFERWGYRFCHGSFGVTKDKYDQALQVLSSLELDIIVHNPQHFSVKKIICRYRDLSDMELLTIRDLFRFMLALKFQTPEKKNIDQPRPKPRSKYGRCDIYKDLGCLYHHVLVYSELETVKPAVKTVLDSKNFTKEWPLNTADDGELLRFICQVIPTERRNSVGEQLMIPVQSTIRDLKSAAEVAMRDTYCVMEKLNVMEIVELEGVADDAGISGTLKSGSQISVRVSGLDQLSDLNYEGGAGADDREVNCKCGARIEDGERMVECHRCGAWEHTWCSGFHEDVPPIFTCSRCRDMLFTDCFTCCPPSTSTSTSTTS